MHTTSAAELTTILVPEMHLSSLGCEIEDGKVGDAAIYDLRPESFTLFPPPSCKEVTAGN